jgi:hypothetical protein
MTTTSSQPGYALTYDQGQQVREVLERYLGDLRTTAEEYQGLTGEEDFQTVKDINYVEGLCQLFDTPNGGKGLVFTDAELKEMVWAAHNYTRPHQTDKEIKAQGTACSKIDAESRYRAKGENT